MEMSTTTTMAESHEQQQLLALVQSLEQASLMAKQLPSTANPSDVHQIYSSLHLAHSHLSSFLLSSPPPAHDPMATDDDADATSALDKVEEKMRVCFIRNKRPKRRLSPSSIALAEEEEERRLDIGPAFDPLGTRLRALDLVYQFHG